MTGSREATAQRELGRTELGRRTATALISLFVLTLVLVPIVQHLAALAAFRDGDRPNPWPQAWQISTIPGAGLCAFTTTPGGPATRTFAANRAMLQAIDDWEQDLDETSVAGAWLRPRAQLLLTGWLGAGNEQVYRGHQGWLFYRPAIDHLVGPGFLSSNALSRRSTAGSSWQAPRQPDPRPAILQLAGQLGERQIELLFVPVPVKASIHPDRFSSRYRQPQTPTRNPSTLPLLDELRQAGVLVYDPGPDLLAAARGNGPQYLRTDTHWRPEAMQLVAQRLAETISENLDLPPAWGPATSTEQVESSGRGDLAAMLELPTKSQEPERVTTEQVITDNDALWSIDPTADVLVLGDSFANIYSAPEMSFGEAAGLVEHLAHHLGRPVDAIVQNNDGAFATRLALSQELARGRDRLAGKRLVIWEVTARELSSGDWRLLPMALGEPQPSTFVVPPTGATWQATGTIAAKGMVPRPRSAPYADYLVALHLVDLEVADDAAGTAAGHGQAVVLVWAMQNYQWTAGAHYRVGQRVSLQLRPWSAVADSLGGINRGELQDVTLMLAQPCWGEEVDR